MDFPQEATSEKTRKKVLETLESFLGLIEPVVFPEANTSGMYEYQFLSEKEREELVIVYKKLMKFLRWGSVAGLNETQDAFNEAVQTEWKSIKASLSAYIQRFQECWEKSIEQEKDVGYLG